MRLDLAGREDMEWRKGRPPREGERRGCRRSPRGLLEEVVGEQAAGIIRVRAPLIPIPRNVAGAERADELTRVLELRKVAALAVLLVQDAGSISTVGYSSATGSYRSVAARAGRAFFAIFG